MATIERKPLPPFGLKPTRIDGADRAEILAQAKEVIDHYLNGPGSYWDEGPRKPLSQTVGDLEAFSNRVTALKQVADDPAKVLESVAALVTSSIEHLKKTIEDSEKGAEMRVPLPDSNRLGIAYKNLPQEAWGRPSGARIATRLSSGSDRNDSAALAARQGSQARIAVPLTGLVSGRPMLFYPGRPPLWSE